MTSGTQEYQVRLPPGPRLHPALQGLAFVASRRVSMRLLRRRYGSAPFGGGYRRCLGAAFADMEMNVVLRTLLREFQLTTTREPGERWRSRGIAYAPGKGGRAVVYRRRRPASSAAPDQTAAVPAVPAGCPYHS